MISERSFRTIMAFADEALRTEWGPSRERSELISARAELDRAYWQAQKLNTIMADPDGPTENVRRLRADRRLVDQAIAHHVTEGLKALGPETRPTTGDLWPTGTYAAAQWHLTRVQLLQNATVDVAAAHLREEAFTALDTNPKEPT
jgi:hypothetical protein